ncbi:MAG TPA: GTP-binding protein [Bacteroidales bacterium]|nr:GTP-binding protein [Bacteroidales bacterium]
MNNEKIPVTIITGFLGSGKTTLLNNLIRKYQEKKFAVIENEFGETGIDGGLIVGAGGNIFELSNGCICCSLSEDFYNTINQLMSSKYVFNHLLIETTGIADPDTIIQSFLSSEDIQMQFTLDSVICLADAVNMEDLIDEQPEVRKQLALSDIVLLNKTDEVQPDYVNGLTQVIRDSNPTAQIFPVAHADVSAIDVLDTFSFSGKAIEKTTLSFRNLAVVNFNGVAQPSVVTRGREHHHDIMSEGFSIPGSFDIGKFSIWMQNFLQFNSDTVFRVKGIVSFDEMPERYIFHAVRASYMFEIGEPWGADDRFSKLIFIGKKLNRDTLENSLYQLLYRPGE